MPLYIATVKSNGSMYGTKRLLHSLPVQRPSLMGLHVVLVAVGQDMYT
jgi:hypothetical protein